MVGRVRAMWRTSNQVVVVDPNPTTQRRPGEHRAAQRRPQRPLGMQRKKKKQKEEEEQEKEERSC
jgi:hypothetical protein